MARRGELIDYEGELFVIWCHKCWAGADLVIDEKNVRCKECNWLIGKLVDDEDYMKLLRENGKLQ